MAQPAAAILHGTGIRHPTVLSSTVSIQNGTWTATTKMYWADLACSRATAERHGVTKLNKTDDVSITIVGRQQFVALDNAGWTFDDGKGCRVENFWVDPQDYEAGNELLLQYLPLSPSLSANCTDQNGSESQKFLPSPVVDLETIPRPKGGQRL